jgi:hypothetical protein
MRPAVHTHGGRRVAKTICKLELGCCRPDNHAGNRLGPRAIRGWTTRDAAPIVDCFARKMGISLSEAGVHQDGGMDSASEEQEDAVIGPEQADAAIFRRIARRVEDILEAARERDRKGQSLALDIDARFRLQDMGAVQFQLASAILEEVGGLRQEEVVSELLSLGLAAVLDGAAKAAGINGLEAQEGGSDDGDHGEETLSGILTKPLLYSGGRVLN